MKTLFAILALSVPCAANTCSGFVVDAITHNSFRVHWTNDDASGMGYAQVQWSLTQSGGSLTGTIGVIGDQGQFFSGIPVGGYSALNVVGLPSNTAIYYAAQSYGVAAAGFCPPLVEGPVTTSAAVTHPVYPTPPLTYTPSYPTQTGNVYIVSPTSDLTCANYAWHTYFPSLTGTCTAVTNLQAAIRSTTGGVPQANFGDLIVVEAGSVEQYSAATQSTTLTLAQGSDVSQITAVDSSGNFTCAAALCGGLTVGQRVIMGSGFDYVYDGETNSNFPFPYSTGSPYWVVSVNTSTPSFKVSQTSGGTAIVPLAGQTFPVPEGCYVVADGNNNVPVPANGVIQIRTSTPDSMLPPYGVRFDPITFPAYAALTAQLQVATPGLSTNVAMHLDMGCLAHDYWIGPGIEFNYLPVNTVGAYDGQAYNTVLATGTANYRLTFDRDWIHGADYPERDYKWGGDLEGHYISVLESTFSGMNFWTPWWNSTPILLTSSTVVTIPSGDVQGNPGKIWFGNGASDYLPFSGTLTLTGGTNPGNAVFEATRSGFFLTLPTGDSATCAIAGQTCTVGTTASPAYAQTGSGYYSRVPIVALTIAGGGWTCAEGTPCDNPPTYGSTQNGGQEGAVAFSITNGPGPYLIRNNYFLNDPGITFYTTGQTNTFVSIASACYTTVLPACQFWPTPVSNIVLQRNTWLIDQAHLANAANLQSNGRFYSMRQHWENKQGDLYKIVGNTFTGAFCANYSGRGYAQAFSSLGGLYVANTDIENGWNTYNLMCQFGQAFSDESGSLGWNSNNYPQLQQRIWWHDNVITGVNRGQQSTPNSFYGVPGDNGLHFSFQGGISDLTIQHSYFGPPVGGVYGIGSAPDPSFCAIVYTPVEGWAFQGNIISYTNDSGHNGCFGNSFNPGTVPNLNAATGSAAITGTVVNNLNWNTNIIFPGWQQTSSIPYTEMSQSQVTTQQSDWVTLVNANYFPNPSCTVGTNCIANRAASIGLQNYALTGGNYALLYNSNFKSGGTYRAWDGKDIGPDYNAMCVQQGCVSGARAISIGATSTNLTWLAPDSYGCTVDWSTDPTFTTFTRQANSGGARAQSVTLSGLTANTAYAARINCAVQQPVVSWTTGTAGLISLVNSSFADDGTGTTHVTFPAPALNAISGNALVVGVGYLSTAGTITVTDTAGNTYIPLTAQARTGGAYLIQFFYASNIIGNASNIVTLNQSNGLTAGSYPSIGVMQFTGLSSTPVDVDNKGSSTVTGTTTSMTSQVFTTAYANEVIVVAVEASASGGYTAGSGYTMPISTAAGILGVEYQIVSSVQSSVQASGNWANASPFAAIAVASFHQ